MEKIVTNHVHPPIPCRDYDWCAYRDGKEEEGQYGWGKTKQAAIDDLLQQEKDDCVCYGCVTKRKPCIKESEI